MREGARKGPGKTKRVATHTLTGAIVGTHGYMPNEYSQFGQVSAKMDIYAFAIVLVELLTSKGGLEVARLHCDEPDLFADMARYVDARAGNWPPATVKALAELIHRALYIDVVSTCTYCR